MRGLALGVLAFGAVSCGGEVDSGQPVVDAGKSANAPADDAPGLSAGRAPGTIFAAQCETRPFATDFEARVQPFWKPSKTAGFHIETAHPLAGEASLRVSLPSATTRPLAEIDVGSACKLTITFAIRADATLLLAKDQSRIMRFVAGNDASFLLFLGTDGQLMLVEELHTKDSVGLGAAAQVGPLPQDSTTIVQFTIDGYARETSAVMAPLGSPLPPAIQVPMVLHRDAAVTVAPIQTVEVGLSPGPDGLPAGTVYWIDNLRLE